MSARMQRVGRNSEAYSALSCDAVGAIRCAIAPYEAKIKLELHTTRSEPV